jgi:hypothetical protein
VIATMMDIDQFQRMLQRAREHALPGHEVADRDELLRALRRQLEAEPRHRAPIRLRLMNC